MKRFRAELAARESSARGRTFVHVPYDQLSTEIGPLGALPAERAGVLLIEDPGKAARRPYHKQKLALVLANMRHFALEQAERGVAVRYVVAREGYAAALRQAARELGPLVAMEPAERELRLDLEPALRDGSLRLVPHEGWLTTRDDFFESVGGEPPFRMDAFYRRARQRTGILMERGKPVGGKYSFDAENRRPWRGEPSAPEVPRFTPDGITEEVVDLVATRFAEHPGTLDPRTLPATRADAEALWRWAKRACLPHFGPHEDAMAREAPSLFHARISPLLNLHRLLPARVVRDVEALDIPLASKEGFIRQVLGWREFVRHVHVATDGFRALGGGASHGATGERESAAPSFLDARRPLPACYWGGRRSGLACLDQVVSDVWATGYSHHITRLMVLSNIATLLGVSPRELTDWFWAAYIDAYDWVVEPNVLGMGTFAAGELMTTKPYISGAAYIAKMSDYCRGCAFDPRSTCPLTPMYWAFLERNQGALADNPRMAIPVRAMQKRSPAQRASDGRVHAAVAGALARGETLSPAQVTPSGEAGTKKSG
jgi:deoxyribodipyrimidine photolyase-related protein